MAKLMAFFLFLLASFGGSAASAAVDHFALVNQTGAALRELALRRVGSKEWLPVSAAPGPGASASISFDHPDCAFDLRATVSGAGQATWRGINLCDVKRVTLNRDSSGRTWVDYD